MTSEEQQKWFYIDDFFIWLGCKFVTCDKDKPKQEAAPPPPPPPAKKEEPKPPAEEHHDPPPP
jgi:hypothetical protein